MITIITGTPGSGKTALVVDMMMDEVRKGRKVFTFGIPDLLLDVHKAGDILDWQAGTWMQIDSFNPSLTKQCGIASQWFPRGCPESCIYLHKCRRLNADDLLIEQRQLAENPDAFKTHFCATPCVRPDKGALLIIDEAHVDFPSCASGKAIPPHVQALMVHRHQGLDIWFLTQRPSFLNPAVRGLSSRHIHLAINPFSFTGKRLKYEWAEFQDSVTRASKMLASKSDYAPSPAVFPLYASATLHTKLDQRMPTIMKMFIIAVLVIVCMAAAAVYRVVTHLRDIDHAKAGISSGSVSSSMPGAMPAKPLVPMVASVPAPVSAVMPLALQLGSCIASESKCRCYNPAGVRVEMTEQNCRDSAAAVTANYHAAIVYASVSSSSLSPPSVRSSSPPLLSQSAPSHASDWNFDKPPIVSPDRSRGLL